MAAMDRHGHYPRCRSRYVRRYRRRRSSHPLGRRMSEDRWDEMRGRLAHMDGKLTALVDAVASLRADLMTRLDRHAEMLNAIRDDVAVNFGTADAVKRANENTREEVRALGDIVSGMHRQIHRLQTQMREVRGDP